MESNSLCIGIDLGTTFSSLSYYNPSTERIEILRMSDEWNCIPSFISFRPSSEDGMEATIERDGSEHCLHGTKRLLGMHYEDYKRQGMTDRKYNGYEIVKKQILQQHPNHQYQRDDNQQNTLLINAVINEEVEPFVPEEVCGIIINRLLQNLQRRNHTVGNVVLSVPVGFTLDQRKELIRACEIAGLQHVDLLYEPVASLYAYQYEYPQQIHDRDKILVIDFGGGTLDVALCEMKKEVYVEQVSLTDTKTIVKSLTGTTSLGGNEFDDVMIDLIIEKMNEQFKMNLDMTCQVMENDIQSEKNKKFVRQYYLRKEAQRVKDELSINNNVLVQVRSITNDRNHDQLHFVVDRSAFEEECYKRGLVARFMNTIRTCLEKAEMKYQDIDRVFLVGGSCKIPMIMNELRTKFTCDIEQLETDGTYHSIVAKGCALFAYEMSLEYESQSIINKMPFSIGIGLKDKRILPLLAKDQSYPTVVSTKVYPIKDKQQMMVIPFYCGEGKHATDQSMYLMAYCDYILPSHAQSIQQSMTMNCSLHLDGTLVLTLSLDQTNEIIGTKKIKIDTLLNDVSRERNHMRQYILYNIILGNM